MARPDRAQGKGDGPVESTSARMGRRVRAAVAAFGPRRDPARCGHAGSPVVYADGNRARQVRRSDAHAERDTADCSADEPEVGSLTDAAARIDALPGAKAVVKSAGLTSREYVVFAFSLIENAYASFALDQPGGKLPPGVSMSNVEFLRAHAGVIEQLANETEIAGCAEDGGSGG